MTTIKEHNKIYGPDEQILEINEHIKHSVHIKMFAYCETTKFLEYQKDLLQDFVANIIDDLKSNEYDTEQIKYKFEIALQDLNTKLKVFAEKVRDVDFFDIKGYVQIVIDGILVSSMIGNVTIMIFRDGKLYYTLHNSGGNKGKIDLFSEFIEGEVESGDTIVYTGTKISDILDTGDIRELAQVIQSEEVSINRFLHELLTSRIEKEKIGFINTHDIVGVHMNISENKFSKIGGLTKSLNIPFFSDLKQRFLKNRYQVTVLILSIFIVFMFYNLVSQLIQGNPQEEYVTSEGITVDLTIDDIKRDITLFKSMDPTGDEKGMKYQEILSKLTTLEQRGRWLEDIAQLKKILVADYYKGFNIIAINDIKQFDDPMAGKKTTLISFNTSEKTKLGELIGIEYQKEISIVGSKSSLLGALNDNMRGALVEYGLDGETIKGCGINLLKNGFYCYTTDGKILLITKSGIETVTTGDPDGFPTNIGGIATYGKANMYVFASNITSLSDSTFVTRYRNTLGSQSIYQQGQKYMISPNLATGMDFGSGFGNVAIDVNFLAWANGKLYQFRRNPPTSFSLDYREIKLLGGDKTTIKYSNNVKILTPANSKYTYLFDKENQTFTVYESRPVKTNEGNQTTYNLYYLFRFSFDLGANKVVDIAVPDVTGNRPEMYILTVDGINKVNLYEFLDSMKDNKVLKQINE